MKALHFGAGNIGRGFIGKTLSQSGFNLIFSDINQNIVDAINYYKKYSVKIVSNHEDTQDNIINIQNIRAINFNDPKINKIIASVDIITTAVGPNQLDKLALIIARGIIFKIQKKSTQIINIIACENKIKASSFLKDMVFDNLSKKYYDYLNQYIGFVDCSIDTIIPSIHKHTNNLFVTAENFQEWIVDINQFKGAIPKIIDMKLSDHLNSFIARKLFTLNTGHAIAAYLGLIKKYSTIYEAISDEKIGFIVKSAMKESGSVLIKNYNFNKTSHLDYIDKIFLRFKNPFLSDYLERVGRNPIQKLGKEERLIKPILDSVKYNLPYSNLSKGVAAALHYRNENDLESMKISSWIQKEGIKQTLIKVCDLSFNSSELRSIISEYNQIFKTIQ